MGGIGYSGPAILDGRVYYNDYDKESSEWRSYCVSLEDGKQLWQFAEKRRIRANHGITRTVPAVDGKYVFSLDPKCVLHCLDAKTGKQLWRKSLVADYKTKIPPWYNGQCPVIEEDRVVIATGGEVLAVALEKATGKEIWKTPNPHALLFSHASLTPAEIGGVKQYLYNTIKGPCGIAADDGRLLWHYPWKFNVSAAPSPLAVDGERVFLTSCYDSGSLMIRATRDGDQFKVEKLFSLRGTTWESEVHTPIVYKKHMFAVGKKYRGLFTCLDFDGQIVWASKGKATFGLGSYLLADDMFFVLEGATGMLRLIDANTSEYRELASAQVLGGHDVWAPMALSNGRLILRDLTKMVCIEVGPTGTSGGK